MGHGLVFDGRDQRFLKLDLPAGRSLFYLKPQVVSIETRYGLKDRLTFEAPRAGGGALQPEQTYGPSLVENIVQGLARDILATGLLRAHRAGYSVRLHVHDEIVAVEPDGSPRDAATLEQLMSQPPSWGLDMLLGAKGHESAFYQK
jgi:DNA polymerase